MCTENQNGIPVLSHSPCYSGLLKPTVTSPIFTLSLITITITLLLFFFNHSHLILHNHTPFLIRPTSYFCTSPPTTQSPLIILYVCVSSNMKPPTTSMPADSSGRRSCSCSLLPIAPVVFLVIIIGSPFMPKYTEKFSGWKVVVARSPKFNTCGNRCRPSGSEALPEGIVATTSDLDLRPLWLPRKKLKNYYGELDRPKNRSLFSVAAGIRQKDLVNIMVKKFLSSGFAVMLFHYDGNVDEWKEFEWSDLVVHVSALNQTKWWFAKRFLHPDIIGEYNYVFLWDEDLGVENFNPERYLSIVKSEGLEISQPALDREKSEVHHQITARGRSKVHRRTYKSGSGVVCDDSSTSPPCTGWVEVMAPVFSRAAWRCVWYMIQNDLVHGWGLDTQLGYCAQGDRTKKVGVVDAEYIIHFNLPTLGGVSENKTTSAAPSNATETQNRTSTPAVAPPSGHHRDNHRLDVRRQAYFELQIYDTRWRKAAAGDECWFDPYEKPAT